MVLRVLVLAAVWALIAPGAGGAAGPKAGAVEDRGLSSGREAEPERAKPGAVSPDRPLQKVRPKPQLGGERRIGPPPPEREAVGPQELGYLARIESFAHEPGRVGHVADGVIAPGGFLTVFGVGFGDAPGRVTITGSPSEFPAGRLWAKVLEWTDNRVRVRLGPSFLKQPLHPTQVSLVVEPVSGPPSPPFSAPFEIPVETRLLHHDGVAASISALHCSDGGNENECSSERVHATHANIMVPHNPFDVDDGIDRWRVRLFEDWAFNSSSLRVESGDASASSEPQAGATEWEGLIAWSCGVQETAEYELRIRVKRARRDVGDNVQGGGP